jgi:hypothetical protein
MVIATEFGLAASFADAEKVADIRQKMNPPWNDFGIRNIFFGKSAVFRLYAL